MAVPASLITMAVDEANAVVIESRRLRGKAPADEVRRVLAARRDSLLALIERLERAGLGHNAAVGGAREAVGVADAALAHQRGLRPA